MRTESIRIILNLFAFLAGESSCVSCAYEALFFLLLLKGFFMASPAVAEREITKAQMVASMLSGPTETASVQLTRPVLLRVPEHVAAQLDAMAALSKKSRNMIGNELLETAIETVRAELSEAVLSKLDERTLLQLLDMQADTSDRQATAD